MDITLDRSQRDTLHAACLLDLSDVDQVELYLRQGDFEEARGLAHRVVGAASLLDDLGWDPHTDEDSFVLRGDPDRLRAVVERLRGQADDSLRDQAAWMTAEPMVSTPAVGGPFARLSRATDAGEDAEGQRGWREEIERSVDEDLDTRLVCDHILRALDAAPHAAGGD